MQGRRVLYSVSGLEEWVNVAKRLKDVHNWEPIIWIVLPGNKRIIDATFPDSNKLDFFDINRGIFCDEILLDSFPLDKAVIDYFAVHEITSLDMMQRYDPFNGFVYSERKRMYYKLLKYWLYTLKYHEIDTLVMSESPHSVAQYICYAVCKYYNINTIMFGTTSIPGIIFPKTDYKDVPNVPIVNDQDTDRDQIFDCINNYFNTLKGNYDIAEPWYMKQQKSNHKTNKMLAFIQRRMNRSIRSCKSSNYYKMLGKPIGNNQVNFIDKLFLVIHSKIARRRLYHNYKQYVQPADIEGKKYLYFPLQFQPERTSIPEGDVFADQLLVIDMIADALPNDWYLYVKEHPSQFLLPNGYMGRREDFYKEVAQKRNVVLINNSYDSFRLIDNSKGVVTLTGTAGLEALTRKIPAIVFGYAWYRECPGAIFVNTNKDCKKTIEMIKNGVSINQSNVKQYLNGLIDYVVLGYLNPSTSKSIDIENHELEDNLLKAVLSAGDVIGH